MCQEVTRWSAALDLTRGWTLRGLRRAAGALVLPPLAFFFRLALETWRSAPDPEGSARINAWASLLVLAAALLRYYDLTVIQPGPGRG